ncbi:MAG TPA: hypothetical protein VGH71_06340 [Gammaproteobacteria bacterium]|jgi:hypothetical protein
MSTISRSFACLSLAMSLVACGKSPQNPAAPPAAASAAAPAVATAGASGTAATPATAPAASSASAAAGTTAAPAAASDNGPEIAGSVAVAQGSVTDTAQDGSVRQLKDGDDVYPGDSFVVGPDSYLDMDLEDTGRILLRPNTSFQITRYHFEPAVHDPNGPTDANGQPLIKPQQPENAFFRLIKGGLRAVDGLIGHSTPQNYGVETPVATIGVRGTAFDVRYCGDDCGDEADAAGKPENGLYTSVTDGSVDVKNDDGDVVTPAGHSGFVKSRKQRMQALATPPKALRHMELPEVLKIRAAKNRSQIHLRRQQRQQRMIERRRAALGKAKAGGRPAAATPAKSLRQRRQERQEQGRGAAQRQQAPADKAARLQQREERREEREQKQGAAPGAAKPAAAGQAPAQGQGLTPRERRQQRREERQQQRGQRPQDRPAAKAAQQPAAKQDQQGEARCKGKRRREKAKDKDKDQCGGG